MARWLGGRAGKGLMTMYVLFTEILGKPPIITIYFRGHIKPKHRKSSWAEKIIISYPAILLTVYAHKGGEGGGSRKMTCWQGGGMGGLDTPKSDDVIYEQPIIHFQTVTLKLWHLAWQHLPHRRPKASQRPSSTGSAGRPVVAWYKPHFGRAAHSGGQKSHK